MLDKTFDPKIIESVHSARWEKSGVAKANPTHNANPYTIMIPPPNVTGSLHMGHAVNNTLQDILIRYHRMKKRNVLWQPGTDHASIVVNMLVTKKLESEGKDVRAMGREAFLKECWEFKKQSHENISNQLRRLGTTMDWSRERFTMDGGYNKAVTTAFVQLYKDGLIYRDKRLVNWDPKLQTVVSDLEAESRDVKGHMWYITYPIEGDVERTITIATTRPETMLGDTGIAVNPEDERYQDLIGKFAILPIVGRPIPIVGDTYVDKESGTGAMKITPAHDFNDFELGKRHKLEVINIFDDHARINSNAPEEYQGLDRFDARKKLLEELESQDLLVKAEAITHAVPHGDRSGVVIEPYLTDQWYCDAKTLAQPAIKAVEEGKTVFVPKNWENTYFEWMRNIQPWCISRQLWWGHQIPAWYGPEGDIFVAENEQEAQEEANKKYGKPVTLRQDPDVLDTWFSSGLWPFATLGWPDKTPELDKYYPGDVLVTAFDIIFFWVARMMMFGQYFMKDVPFHTVYIHALVRDAKGQKMSKSKGNVIDPLETIEKYGTDALRFTLTAMAAQGRDIRLSDDRIAGYRNFATKLWNAARYCEMNGCNPPENFDPTRATHMVNQWIIGEVVNTQNAIDTALAGYKFNDAANAIYSFVWGTFCDWYLEFTKPILGEGNTNDTLKQETRDTTGWVLDQILVLLNPFMPFITEELYESMAVRPSGSLLMAESWPSYDAALVKKTAADDIAWLIRAISEIRSVRTDMNVPPKAFVRLMIKDADAITKERAQTYDEVLRRMARVESVEYVTAAPKGAIQTVVGEASFILPIADIIDLDKERARLKKEIEKLNADIEKLNKQLSNQDFVARAAPEVVDEQRERLKISQATKEKLSSALMQLDAA